MLYHSPASKLIKKLQRLPDHMLIVSPYLQILDSKNIMISNPFTINITHTHTYILVIITFNIIFGSVIPKASAKSGYSYIMITTLEHCGIYLDFLINLPRWSH